MNILVINRGSSSIRCSLYQFSSCPDQYTPPLWESHEQVSFEEDRLEELLTPLWAKLKREEVDVIGHRVVHGGRTYRTSVRIDQEAKTEIQRLSALAPLHNLANLKGIELAERLFPGKPQVALFDTAFHRTLPPHAKLYPGPYEWYEEEAIERYGFHGISHQYCTARAAQLLERGVGALRLVICHLGSGASLCAVRGGKSVDTTMGFTPLEGVMMDTRSGSVDPGILLYLLQKKTLSVDALYEQLYHNSGLLGISGRSEDMRVILQAAKEGDPRAELALALYVHRLKSAIGSMVASLGGIDALVFTGGIGESAASVREKVCEGFGFLGIAIDPKSNAVSSREDRPLSRPEAAGSGGVSVLLVHTQEAFEIACACWQRLAD